MSHKRKGSKLKIKIRAVGWQKGRLKGRSDNKRHNKGNWRAGKT